MARPDPNAIRRLPQASAPPHFVRARRDAAPATSGALRLFDAQGALDVDALFRLVDDGEVTLEGRVYGVGPQARFMGSAVLELDVDVALAPRLRAALSGEKVTEEYETFKVDGFRLGVRVKEQPPILVGALREGMLRLAGREGDGAIVNWLSAEDVRKVAPIVGEGKEVAARIFVMPSEDREAVRQLGTRLIAEYLNVPVYAAFHEWVGRGEALREMWDAWQAGDRKRATASIPDEVLDDLIVNGTPEECAAHVRRYAANGITTPAPMILAGPDDAMRFARALAPGA